MQSMGILGGSFDPIHNGHMHIATQVERITHLEEIRFIPCKSPVLKAATIANADQRFEMLNIALSKHATWTADDRELLRNTPSYMIETLMSLRKDYPKTSLNLILGWDAFQELTHWHQWSHLIDYANLVVVNRAEVESTLSFELNNYVEEHCIQDPHQITSTKFGKIALLSCTELPISSSVIREKIRNGHDVSGLVPKSVWEYIQSHHVYFETQ